MLELDIAIVDDAVPDSVRLKNFIQNYFCEREHVLNKIISFASGEDILKIFEPKMFQIVFMDIIMDSLNGIETARHLRAEDAELLIVFMTTSREYAFEAFHVHPFDYIVKPYTQKEIDKVLDEALRVLTAHDPIIAIMSARSEYKIPLRLISSAVSMGHTVEINLVNGKKISATITFREIEKLLSDDKRFLLCNRGIIVNMSQISAQDKGVFIMKNGSRYPIRVNGQSKVTAAFSQYLISNMRADNTK
ncbi:MAG: response regulator transcription factor [Synergistaceae bacterium]|nr:response regulator transcription factor [Synergistaceae bacterium]